LDAPLKALEKNSTVAMPAKTISAGDADHGLLVAHRNIALP
jgi:hypothetical protein